MIIARFVVVVLVGYLLGSIPFGLLISKRSSKVDIRQYGSGNSESIEIVPWHLQ